MEPNRWHRVGSCLKAIEMQHLAVTQKSHLRKELEGWGAQIGNATQGSNVERNSFEEFSRQRGMLDQDIIVMDDIPYQDFQKINHHWDLCSSLFGLISEETSLFLFLYCYNFEVSAT